MHKVNCFCKFACGKLSLCYQTKVGVWLHTTTNRQILEAEVGEKGKRSLLKCCTVWESGRLLSQRPFPLGDTEENPATLSQTKTKGSVQSSFSYSKCCPWGAAAGCWVVIQAAQLFSHPLSGLRLPPENLHVGPAPPLAKWLQGPEGPTNTLASAFASWARAPSFLPLGLYLFSCVGWNRFFLSPNFCIPRGSIPLPISSFPPANLIVFFNTAPPPAAFQTSMHMCLSSPGPETRKDTGIRAAVTYWTQ